MKIFNIKEKKHLPYKKSKKKKVKDQNQLPLFQGKVISLHGESLFEKALELDFDNNPLAYDMYMKAIEEGDSIDESYNNLGILEISNSRTKAFGHFFQALKHNPSHCEAQFNLANLYFEEKEFNLAELHYQIAVEVDPYFANTYYNLALVQIEMNKLEDAEKNLNKYISLVGTPEREDALEIINQIVNYK